MGGMPTNWKTQVIRDEKSNAIVPGLLAVFGRQAADTTLELVKPNSPKIELPKDAGHASIARMDKMRNAKGPIPTAMLRRELQSTMQTLAPVYRNSADLAKGKG